MTQRFDPGKASTGRARPTSAEAPADLTEDILSRLTDVQRGAQMLYAREAERMARKHGLEDPRTQRMIATAQGALRTLHALEITEESKIDEPEVPEGAAIIHGRAAGDDLRGIPDLNVMLEDTSGRVMRAAGSARTDETGYYRLTIPSEVAARLADKPYLVTARDAKDTVVYRAATPFTLEVDTSVRFDFAIARPAPVPPVRPDDDGKPGRKPRPRMHDEPFYVRGRVLTAEGKPAPGLLVRVYDRDVRYDDLIGAALTGRKGEFTVIYRMRDFSEGEAAADLYFVVLDSGEHELLSTRDHVIFNAERETTVELVLGRRG